jgi:hypothetical protein
MKAKVLLSLVLLAGVCAAAHARAEEPAPQNCEVPAYLLTTESRVPKVTDVIRLGRPLEILVVGSRSSSIPSAEDSAYPARLQVALKDMLPSAPVRVSVELQNKKSAEEVASGFVKLVEARNPKLVIWQTGTIDAMRSIDPDDFRKSVANGVIAVQNAGADVILRNLQYSPRTETMIMVPPYLDAMRLVAEEHAVPLFDRFAIMRHWHDHGDFDLFSATRGNDLAKRVHDCLGRALAKFVLDAANLAPTGQN